MLCIDVSFTLAPLPSLRPLISEALPSQSRHPSSFAPRLPLTSQLDKVGLVNEALPVALFM